MNIWQKAKSIFSRKDSRTAALIRAPGSGGTIWTPKGYDNFAKETYLKNVTAFTAIREVAQSVASVPWKQFRKLSGGGREEEQEGDVVEVLKRPNPTESLEYVILRAAAFLVMSGNGFLERIKLGTGPNSGQLRELYTLRPDRFEIGTNSVTGQVGKYIYKVQGRKVEYEVDPVTLQSDILHLKTFHPLDDWWGAAATEAAAREVDTSNAATQWNKSLIDQQGRPGMVYTLVGQLGVDQFDSLERTLEERAGPENVGRDIIITGDKGTTVTPYGWTPADLDFNEGDHRLMRKIAMGYGVPPMLIGIPGEATFANYKEARLAFWENTIFFWLNYLKGELNNWLFEKDSEMFLDYILDDVPALAVKRDMLWDRARTSDFLTLDEKRELVGKDKYEPSDDPGSMIFIEASKIPIEAAGIEEEEEEEIEEEEEEKKTYRQLLDQGYNVEEIEDMLGVPTPAWLVQEELDKANQE